MEADPYLSLWDRDCLCQSLGEMSENVSRRMPNRLFSGNGEAIPQANHEERRAIRQKYRELIDQTQDEEDMGKSLDKLTSILEEADSIFEKQPQMPREAAMDSKLLNQLSTLGASYAQSMDTNVVTFHPADFTELLLQTKSIPMEKDAIDWNKFGENVSCLFRRAPAFNFMYGSFETDLPERPEKQKEKKSTTMSQAIGERQEPEKISEMGKSDKEVTTAEVDRVLMVLRYLCDINKGPVCFFEFVVHPESFSQTVLNIFHVTFLIRDGYAIIYSDNDGFPVIEPITDQTGGPASNAPKPVKNEMVMSMNKSQWREIVEAFQIDQILIPPPGPLPGRASQAGCEGPSGLRGSSSKRRH